MVDTVNKMDVLEILSRVKPDICRRYKVKSLSLFGSVVREKTRPDSDIDVLIDFEEGADLFDLMAVTNYLEEQLGHKVDAVSRRGLKVELKEIIESEAVPV